MACFDLADLAAGLYRIFLLPRSEADGGVRAIVVADVALIERVKRTLGRADASAGARPVACIVRAERVGALRVRVAKDDRRVCARGPRSRAVFCPDPRAGTARMARRMPPRHREDVADAAARVRGGRRIRGRAVCGFSDWNAGRSEKNVSEYCDWILNQRYTRDLEAREAHEPGSERAKV